MKQHHLSSRFLTFYICIGIFGFFLITLGGSYMVEKYFESAQSTTLYEDVCSIASSDLLKEQLSDPEGSHILEEISGFTELHDSVLWITDTQGQLVSVPVWELNREIPYFRRISLLLPGVPLTTRSDAFMTIFPVII